MNQTSQKDPKKRDKKQKMHPEAASYPVLFVCREKNLQILIIKESFFHFKITIRITRTIINPIIVIMLQLSPATFRTLLSRRLA